MNIHPQFDTLYSEAIKGNSLISFKGHHFKHSDKLDILRQIESELTGYHIGLKRKKRIFLTALALMENICAHGIDGEDANISLISNQSLYYLITENKASNSIDRFIRVVNILNGHNLQDRVALRKKTITPTGSISYIKSPISLCSVSCYTKCPLTYRAERLRLDGSISILIILIVL